jgi:two-component system sensor histidine kinase YesM
MRRWKRLPFGSQIFMVFITASGFLLGLMALTLFFSTSGIIRQEVAGTTATAIEKSGRQLEMYIDELKGFSELLVENPQIRRYFGESPSPGTGGPADKADIEALVTSVLAINPEIASIILVGADGKLISNEKTLDMSFSGNIRDKEWYKAILTSGMPVLTSARMQEFSMNKDTWVISLGRELKDFSGNHIGVLRIDLRYDVIEAILQDVSLGRSGYAFILNQDKQVVYHKDPSYFTDGSKRLELLHMLEMPDNELSRGFMLLHRYPLSNADWLLVGVATLDGVLRVQKDIILAIWLIGSVLLALALISSTLFSNTLTRPLKQLEKAMSQVELGILESEVPPGGNAETESLSRHFLSMMTQVRLLMEEVRTKEQSLRASELKTLYGQINPHFLYNTLDAIVWLAELGKVDRVVHVSKAMARFFRLSLHGGSEWTTVREELDHARQYLTIQQERYGEVLHYEITSDETVLDEVIPKILLQPLVENSIYHGLRKIETPWHIHISAKDGKDIVTLSVEDNGAGFDASVPARREEKGRLGGIGLQNVEERIRLHYGDVGSLAIDSEAGKGALITLRLGKKPSGKGTGEPKRFEPRHD